ncbi:MAG: amidohydrolase family protein [Acidobacteria bacterium]|nr:amidohydrolase family protein [Acidobacteriota bacterium]
MRMLPLVALLSAIPASSATVLHCGKLIDVENLQVREQMSIVVRDGSIERVAPGYVTPASGDEAIDLKSQTCMPGWMDMHVHLVSEINPKSYEEGFRLNPADNAYHAAANAKKTLLAGFTTVRDLGTEDLVSISLKRAIAQGLAEGPTIYNAGKALATTGGHADPTNGVRWDMMGDPGPDLGVVNGVDDARKAVRQRYKEGSDLIKITATGGVLSVAKNGHNPQFTEEEIHAIVETAKDYGFHVAAHAHGAEGMKRAIRAGVHSIEHGTLMDDEAIELFKERGTWWVPTISAGRFVMEKAEVPGYFPPVIVPKALAIGPQVQETFRKAYRAGVKIAFGTDCGVSPHGTNAREFLLMNEAGMPPLETIQTATLRTAQLLGVEKETGTLTAGKEADIVATPADPSQDLATVMSVSFVMSDGVVYKRP